jgi:DNA polymerase-3 subunit chi
LSNDRIRVDFYVLESPAADARARFACRLSEKAWTLGHQVHALTADPAASGELDELMWTFRPDSFLPHDLWPDANAETPVTIGHDASSAPPADLLINLTDEIPPCIDQFGRIAEIIDASPGCRSAGRTRFGFYRDQGYDPQTHRIG